MKKGRVLFPCLLFCLLLAACQTGGQQKTPESSTSTQTSAATTTPMPTTPPQTTAEATAETTIPATEPPASETIGPDGLAPVNPPYFSNGVYRYQITFPESWTGRYGIYLRNDNTVVFCQQASYGEDNSMFGKIFSLHALSRESFDEAYPDLQPGNIYFPDPAPWEHMLIGKSNKYVFIVTFPSDMQYEVEGPYSETIGKEYEAMQDDIRSMRFKFTASDFKEPLH